MMTTVTPQNWQSFIVIPVWIMVNLRDVFAVQTSKLQVQVPQSLRRPQGYDHLDAMFGIPPYGGSIQQQVYYTHSTLCDGFVDKTTGYPQRADHSGWKSPYILMIDRGDCSFVQQVRTAQRAGATAVLIADNVCQCDRPCSVHCAELQPKMSDDGSGSDISIPSFLIFKEDADEIKSNLMKNEHVRVEMSFKVPNTGSRVEYELWTSASDLTSRSIEQSFGVAAAALEKYASFTPHMYIYDGIKAGCQEGGQNECGNLCTNYGRYCSTDPDDDLEHGTSGADVVKECLRRNCIWNQYGHIDGIGLPWWNYVKEFIARCDSPDSNYPSQASLYNNPECAADAMTKAGIDVQAIATCMEQSGGLDADTTNLLLEEEVMAQEAAGVVMVPSLVVNQAVIRGSISFATVFQAICAGFVPGSEPDICKECVKCTDELACVTRGYCYSSWSMSASGVPLEVFALVLLGLSVVFVTGACVQHYRQQRYMRDQIRGVMAEYMPVSSQKVGEGTSMALSADDDDDNIHHHESFTIS